MFYNQNLFPGKIVASKMALFEAKCDFNILFYISPMPDIEI